MEDIMVKYKKEFTETVVHDDLERKQKIEKNYSMEYKEGPKGSTGYWIYNLKDPKTGEILEKRANRGGAWKRIWRKADEE